MKNNIIYGKAEDLFPRSGTVVIADKWFHGRGVVETWGCPVLWIEADERKKSLATVESLISQLAELEADRDTTLIGVGGGITTDITGFTAAVYKRGIRFGLVPTTLLAQIDAALGGKNGVNFDGYKNMLGTFREADFVYIDTGFLKTLGLRELRCGAAELLKTFLIADAEAYEEAVALFSGAEPYELPARMIRRAGEIKMSLVEQDPQDKGVRRLLNLGHSFAHAIEKCSTEYLHGEAVATGIVMAAEIARENGLMTSADAERIRRDFIAAGLPVDPPVPKEELRNAMLQDKKRSGDKISLVLPAGIGKATIWDCSVSAL